MSFKLSLPVLLFSALMSAGATGQVNDTVTTSYDVGGVQVIHRQLAANDIVAVNLYLLGGSRQLDARTAGVEAMLLRASEFGTARYLGREARLALARTGSRMYVSTEPDWTLFGFYGLRTEFDATWDLFADRVMQPALDSAGVEVVRRKMLRSARSQSNHPDAMVRLIADSVAFQGHAYQHDPEGTEATVRSITIEDLRAYQAAQMVTSRMLLVVVGNIPKQQLEAAITRTLAQLPKGQYVWSLPPVWRAEAGSVTVRDRVLPTNYILGYFAGPPANSEHYLPFRIATLLVGGFAAYEIRDNGLSYAAHSPFLERGASGGGIYVTTTEPDAAMKIFNRMIELLREQSVDRRALQSYYRGFATSYYSQNESNTGQADFLARHELLHGDWRLAGQYVQNLKRVQGYQISNAVREFVRNIRYVYIGNPDRVPRAEMTKRF